MSNFKYKKKEKKTKYLEYNGNERKAQSFVDTFNSFMEKCETAVEYANVLEVMPPRGDGAKDAVSQELGELFAHMHKQLTKMYKHLVNKVWEE